MSPTLMNSPSYQTAYSSTSSKCLLDISKENCDLIWGTIKHHNLKPWKDGRLSSSSIQAASLNDFGSGTIGRNGQQHLTGNTEQTAESLAAQSLVNNYVKNGGYTGYEQLLQLSNGNYFQDCLTSHHHHISHSNRPAGQRHILNDKDPAAGSYDNNNLQLSPAIWSFPPGDSQVFRFLCVCVFKNKKHSFLLFFSGSCNGRLLLRCNRWPSSFENYLPPHFFLLPMYVCIHSGFFYYWEKNWLCMLFSDFFFF